MPRGIRQKIGKIDGVQRTHDRDGIAFDAAICTNPPMGGTGQPQMMLDRHFGGGFDMGQDSKRSQNRAKTGVETPKDIFFSRKSHQKALKCYHSQYRIYVSNG